MADELVVSGNGAESQNNVNVTQSSENTSTQNNEAAVQNNVDSSAQTGNNSANDNSGDNTQITTGDATNVVNAETAVNASVVETGCCADSGTTAIVSDNGQGSESNLNLNNNSQTNTNINQNATVTTNIQGYANTGHNKANDNSGNVSIETGNIYAEGQVQNFTNFAYADVSSGTPGVLVKITDNDRDTTNNIYLNLNNNTNVNIDNNSRLYNTIKWELNTGWNEANDNKGNVKIKTGDIYLKTVIQNLANIAKVIVDCNCEAKANEPPKENPPSSNPPSGNGGGGGGGNGGGGGSSSGGSGGSGGGGSVLGDSLPATGANSLFGMTLIAIMMLAAGLYLRQSSNRYRKSAFYPRFRYNTLHLV